MKSFKPFVINHLQIHQLDAFAPSGENQYLVFWWKNVPLGNLWVYGDSIIDPILFKLKVAESIQPSIDYYVSTSKSAKGGHWKSHFLAGEEKIFEDELMEIIPLSLSAYINGDLSVVICTRNKPQATLECVKALMASTDLDFELIVVDNAPDDDSTEQALKQFDQVRYIKEPCKGLDIARNTGARFASHSIIAYTDDDVIVDKNWTKNLKNAFQDPFTMAVTGLVIPASLQTKAQYIFEHDWGLNKGYVPRVFDKEYFTKHLNIGVPVWDIGAGANMAFRRQIFSLVGWFDQRLDVGASGCSGDFEFWYRILAKGWNCSYFPQLFVYHQHHESEKALKSQIFYYMRGQVSSLLVQYDKYRHKRNFLRAYKILPKYYLKKICKNILQLNFHSFKDNLNQMQGCISGWRHYKGHRHESDGSLLYLKKLDKKPIINEQTKVSVIIPCYNHGRYLKQAIESVYNQTFKNVEIIVVNDGSTDNTKAVCKNFPHVRCINTNRLGLSGARNMGIKYSTGDFLIFLDADDFLYPNALEINLNCFSKNEKSVFVSGAHDKIDNNGNLLPVAKAIEKVGYNYESLLQGNYIAMEGAVMYRKELFYSFFFDPQLNACEDYDINLRIKRYFPSLTHTEKIAAYRIHDHMSADKNLMLNNAMTVQRRQENVLRNPDEFEAYNKGLLNWQYYYSNN